MSDTRSLRCSRLLVPRSLWSEFGSARRARTSTSRGSSPMFLGSAWPRSWWHRSTFTAIPRFLAPSAAVLGGLGASWMHQRSRIRWPALVPALVVLAALSQTAFDGFTLGFFRNPDQRQLAGAIQRMVPRESPIYALEPGWLIVADRLPDAREGVLGGWPGYQ